MIETNQIFLQKEGVNKIELGVKAQPISDFFFKGGSVMQTFPPSSKGITSPPKLEGLSGRLVSNVCNTQRSGLSALISEYTLGPGIM